MYGFKHLYLTRQSLDYTPPPTTSDILTIVSAALDGAGLVCTFIPGAQVAVGPLLGASFVVSLVNEVFCYKYPNGLHIQTEDGVHIYINLIA